MFAMEYYDRLAPFTPTSEYAARRAAAGTDFMGIGAAEYSLVEKVNLIRGLLDTGFVMYPQVQDVDLRRDVRSLALPVYVLAGRYELAARAALVPEWLAGLHAPR